MEVHRCQAEAWDHSALWSCHFCCSYTCWQWLNGSIPAVVVFHYIAVKELQGSLISLSFRVIRLIFSLPLLEAQLCVKKQHFISKQMQMGIFLGCNVIPIWSFASSHRVFSSLLLPANKQVGWRPTCASYKTCTAMKLLMLHLVSRKAMSVLLCSHELTNVPWLSSVSLIERQEGRPTFPPIEYSQFYIPVLPITDGFGIVTIWTWFSAAKVITFLLHHHRALNSLQFKFSTTWISYRSLAQFQANTKD